MAHQFAITRQQNPKSATACQASNPVLTRRKLVSHHDLLTIQLTQLRAPDLDFPRQKLGNLAELI